MIDNPAGEGSFLATSDTVAPGASVSSTIRALSSGDIAAVRLRPSAPPAAEPPPA